MADTSAWVEFDRATGSAAHLRLRDALLSTRDVAVSEPIVAEVATGARSAEREAHLRRLLGTCDLLPFDAVADFDGGVRVYRECRSRGVTPRGLLDCLIAAVAVRFAVPVLSHDADLARIADVVPLRLDPASLHAPPT